MPEESCGHARRGAGPGTLVPGRVSAYLDGALRYGFFVVPLVFYFLTACRTPGWIDAALITSNVYELQLGSWVNTHNLFQLIGYLWLKVLPGDNVHYQLVLLSALFGALTIHAVYLIGVELTANRIASATGALVLMISHSIWWHSTMVEVYTLNAACIAFMFLFIARFDRSRRPHHLCLAGFLFGLGCSNHVLVGLFLFAFVGFTVAALIKKRCSFAAAALLLPSFLLGFSLYIYGFSKDYFLVVENAKNAPGAAEASASRPSAVDSFRYLLGRATGGEFKKYMFPRNLSPEERRFWRSNYPLLFCLNFFSPALFIGLYGFVVFFRRRYSRLTLLFFLLGLIAQVIWSSNYLIWDMYAFSMPVYLLFSVPLVLGLDALMRVRRWGRLILLVLTPTFLLPPFLYARIPALYESSSLLQRYFSHYPEIAQVADTWDAVPYVVNPNKRRYNDVARLAAGILSLLPEAAHYWTDDSRCDYPLRLYYRDVLGQRTDIRYHSLFGPFMNESTALEEAGEMKELLLSGRSVYLASIGFPHRPVLDQLYLLLDPTGSAGAVSAMSGEKLRESFPVFRIEPVPVLPDRGILRYRMVPR